MVTRTYSVEEAAQILRGSSASGDVSWLQRHLRGETQPQLPGFKAGRRWRMTEADIEAAIELLRPRPAETNSRRPQPGSPTGALPPAGAFSSLTPTSRRYLLAGR